MAKRGSSVKKDVKTTVEKAVTTPKSIEPRIDVKAFGVKGFTLADVGMIVEKCRDEAIRDVTSYNMLVLALIIIIMVQIRISCSSSTPQEVDGLDSYKFYKKRFISGAPGLSWCTGIALMENVEHLDIEGGGVDNLLVAYTESPPSPGGKPRGKASKTNVGDFINSKISQLLSTLQSCPSNNFKLFGLAASCEKWGIDRALAFAGFRGSDEQKIEIIEMAREIFKTSPTGIPSDMTSFKENSRIKSNLEGELFGGMFLRTDAPSAKLGADGTGTPLTADGTGTPLTKVTKDVLRANLSSKEFISYTVASRIGDKQLLSRLNKKVIAKLRSRKVIATLRSRKVIAKLRSRAVGKEESDAEREGGEGEA